MVFYNISKPVTTNKDLKSVMEATVDALRPLGGSININSESGNIRIINGKSGITGDFLLNADATIQVSKKSDDKYIINAQIEKRPSGIFWILLVVGLCFLWPVWLVNLYYLLIDLGKEYDVKLSNVDGYL